MRKRIAVCVALVMVGLVAVSCTGVTGENDSVGGRSSEVTTRQSAEQRAIPTVIAIDVSGSMRTDDLSGARVDAARAAVSRLIDTSPADSKIGLVRFGGGRGDADPAACTDVAGIVPVGPVNRAAIDAGMKALVPKGRTPTGLALEQAARLLPATASSSIIIVSDGEANCAPYTCDVAQDLHRTHPQLMISAIALHAPATAFRCLTAPSGGLSVSADSARQLTRRLSALGGDIASARRLLAPTGAQGITVGQKYDQIRSRHADFPQATISTTTGDATVIEWRDCGWVFDSAGVLTQIRVASGSTIDGVAVGDDIARAREEYGTAVSTEATRGNESSVGGEVTVFVADPSAGTQWRMITSGNSIRRIALCRCSSGSNSRYVADFPDIADLQALPEAGDDGLYGRWWIRGSTLVIDRDNRRVYIWSAVAATATATEVIARIDRIDGAGGAATVIESSSDVTAYAPGSTFAFSAHPLEQGVVLSVLFARTPARDWCGVTVIASCFD